MKGVPEDYYSRLYAMERGHWWQVGMQEITAALLGPWLARPGGRLLDAGCGTGGFLAWISGVAAFDRLAGIDVSAEAIAFAREAVPGGEFRVMGLTELPFGDGDFDVVTMNDVLQHVDEDVVQPSLGELRRVLKSGGALLVRTNGGRRARRERADWRLYDAAALSRDLEQAGFRVERVTYANMLLSLVGSARGRAPTAPTATTCGIPRPAGAAAARVGRTVVGLEAHYLRGAGRSVPFGHTLFALATPAGAGGGSARS